MNWLLLGTVVFLVINFLEGRRVGFVRKIVGIVALGITLVATFFGAPYLESFLKNQKGLHTFIENIISDMSSDTLEIIAKIGGEKLLGMYLGDMIIKIIAFLIVLVLVGILIGGLTLSLDILTKLPIIHGINKLAGGILGLGLGVFWVWIFFLVVTMLSNITWANTVLRMISESEVLMWFYNENIILKIFLKSC